MGRDDGALAHAWAYFQLHAAQRITIFNYFVVLSGILATGLAAAIQAPPRLARRCAVFPAHSAGKMCS